MMRVRIATFNLNNLFSRYNFAAEITDAQVHSTVTFDANDPTVKVRSYTGRLVSAKPGPERVRIAERLRAVDADVVAVQEAEDIDTLTQFARDDLDDYPYVVLVEGNDPRLIDVGLLSRLPLGGVTSWRQAVHRPSDREPVFSRDLLEVDVLSPDRKRRLVTVYNSHFKSHFVPFNPDPVATEKAHELADARRLAQAETTRRILDARQRPQGRFVLCGDLNDPPDSPQLAPLGTGPVALVDGLAAAVPDAPAPVDSPPAPDRPWTYRHKEAGQPAEYSLFDHIWLSPAVAPRLTGAGIQRRTRKTKDGSDHDPAWVDLEL